MREPTRKDLIPDSEASHPPGAVERERLGTRDRIRVRLVLRPAAAAPDPSTVEVADPLETVPPRERPRPGRAELEEQHAPHDEHVDRVVRFAAGHGLEVRDVSRLRHDVVLEGTAAEVGSAFGVDLCRFEHGGEHYRAHRGPIRVPAELRDAVEGVLGLDDAPLGRRYAAVPGGGVTYPLERIAELYRFPPGADGTGERIAVLAFGGGFHAADLDAFFAERRSPRVETVSVLGADNEPLDAATLARFVADFDRPEVGLDELLTTYGPAVLGRAMATIEVTMDVEIVGALAPGAHVDVYFAPNTKDGWYTAVYAALGDEGALADTVRYAADDHAEHGTPTVVSLSWGNTERIWTANAMRPIHRALELAKDMGVTVCCASGDFGSRGAAPGDVGADTPSVSFPASSPFALACGGTRLELARDGRQVVESAWNDPWKGIAMATGGGLSGLFARPAYQRGAGVPDPADLSGAVWRSPAVGEGTFRPRGVPDVAALADAGTGYRIHVGGRWTAGGGTSAATPLWAALVAVVDQQLGRPVGWLTPLLYRPAMRPALREVARGHNDVSGGRLVYFAATDGWDACTGYGTPDGTRLVELLAE